MLEAEFGVAITVIQLIAYGVCDCSKPRTISPEVCREIKRRQDIWALENERMQHYTLKALAKKYGVCVNTIVNRAAEVRRQQQAAKRRQVDEDFRAEERRAA